MKTHHTRLAKLVPGKDNDWIARAKHDVHVGPKTSFAASPSDWGRLEEWR